jgi:FkbM family methyltransferase
MNILESVIKSIPEWKDKHYKDSSLHSLMLNIVRDELDRLVNQQSKEKLEFPFFGNIILPYFKMGQIDSIDLLEIDALILYAFYWKNKMRYRNILDLGANIGAHAIVLGKLGFNVQAYEPDPKHFEQLTKNIKLNNIKNVQCFNSAVSDFSGKASFTRVLGNTTASHLSGAKEAYGDLEVFDVTVCDIRKIMTKIDLVKMDVEGAEAIILEALNEENFRNTDFLIEVGNEQVRSKIFTLANKFSINAFSQKNGWRRASCLFDIPSCYKEGELFLSMKNEMPW